MAKELKENPTFLAVAAARIVDPDGRTLLQQALPGKRHAGMWEFPGGKVEPGEGPRGALVREVAEELGITLSHAALCPDGFVDEPAMDGRPALVLFLYSCARWRGQPRGCEGQAWGWFTAAQIAALPLAALDRALVEAVRGRGPG